MVWMLASCWCCWRLCASWSVAGLKSAMRSDAPPTGPNASVAGAIPTRSEEEIARFLQVVGGKLGLQTLQLCKLSPDDRGADFEPLFGGMEVVQLLMAVEEAYGLDLPDDFLKTCENLGQLFAYVTQHGTVRPVSPATGLRNQLTNATKSG